MGVLILPAIAMNRPICGFEEHQHGAQCYAKEKVLVCGMDENSSNSMDNIALENISDIETAENIENAENTEFTEDIEYIENTEYADDTEDAIADEINTNSMNLEEKHQHTDACYREEERLVCQIPEHIHDASCTENSIGENPKEASIDEINFEGENLDTIDSKIEKSDEAQIDEPKTDEIDTGKAQADETEIDKEKTEKKETSDEEKVDEKENTDEATESEEKKEAEEDLEESEEAQAEETSADEEEGDQIATVDTSMQPLQREINSGIKMHLFNYGRKINDSTYKNNGLDFFNSNANAVDGTTSGNSSGPAMNLTLGSNGYPTGTFRGRNINLAYLFHPEYGNNIDDLECGGTGGYFAKKAAGKDNFQLIQTTSGWPRVDNRYTRLNAELDGDGGLFRKDEDGFLIYDSKENSASYDYESKKFKVYDHTVRPKYTGANDGDVAVSNFLPFNDSTNHNSTTPKRLSNGTLNYQLSENTDLWFGMTMEMDYFMPKDGEINGKDMVFEFSGDDDVWVYIDDVLVLDIGGCHAAQNGSINFATGEVKNPKYADDVGGNTIKGTNLKNIFQNAGKDVTTGFNENTFSNYTKHNLKFFYLERGGNISYCKLKFNMNPLPEGSLSVKKELSYDETITEAEKEYIVNNYTYKFQCVDINREPLAGLKGKSFDILDQNNNKTGYAAEIDDNGCFEIGAGESIVIDKISQYVNDNNENADKKCIIRELIPENEINLYGAVHINGNLIEKSENSTVEIDGKKYYVFEHEVKSLETNSANFVNDNNTVTAEKMGWLEISKQISNSNKDWNDTFQFEVKLNGNPVKDGTKFAVLDADGNSTSEMIEARNGVVLLQAGQTVRMASRLLEGTEFEIREQENTLGENWKLDRYELTTIQNGVSETTEYDPELQQSAQIGIIANAAKRVTAYNKRSVFEVDIPVSKQFLNLSSNDDKERTAVLSIKKMLNENEVDPDAKEETMTLQCNGTNVTEGQFHIEYDGADADKDAYYYQITEKECTGAEAGEVILLDKSVYVVEVKITQNAETGKYSAKVSKLYKDGQEVEKETNPDSGDSSSEAENGKLVAAFVNHKGVDRLPDTGGFGTTWYIFSGVAIMLLSLALIYIKKHRKWREAR